MEDIRNFWNLVVEKWGKDTVCKLAQEIGFDMYFLDETYELVGDGDHNIHNTFSELVDIVLKLSCNDFDLAEEIMKEAGMPEDQIEFLLN